jgi:hypothetical protein
MGRSEVFDRYSAARVRQSGVGALSAPLPLWRARRGFLTWRLTLRDNRAFERTELEACQKTGGSKSINVAVTLHIHACPSVIDRYYEDDLPRTQTADDLELSTRPFAQS